jgi:hypothetical protein
MAKQTKERRKLFRVIFRGPEFLGTWDEWHAKVVADDIHAAIDRALEHLQLDQVALHGALVTMIATETELPEGKVFEAARRSRAFGQRGAWIDEPVERRPGEPRKTPLL